MTKRLIRLAAVALGLSLAGCRCDRVQTDQKYGELNFVFEQGGITITSPDGDYDFGKVAMGVKRSIKVRVENRGAGRLDLSTLELLEGEPTKIGDATIATTPVFIVSFQPQSIVGGGTAELDAVFDAPLETDPTVRTKEHSVKLLLRVTGNAPGTADTGEITLHGVAVSGACTLPETLDFGAVAVGDTQRQTVELENNSPISSTAFVGAITSNSGDDRSFIFAPESVSGEVVIETGLKRDVVIGFSPTEPKDYFALVKMKAAEQCPEVSVKLVGVGVDQVLNCAPNPMDFGYITPGLALQGELTLSNSSLTAVDLTGAKARFGTAISQEFRLLGADALTVPAATRVPQPDGSKALVAGIAKVQVEFKPQLLGPRTAVLSAATTLGHQPELACPLKGAGGGPDIDVKPSGTLNFQRVPYFATAPKPFYSTRKITVQNVGTLPNPPDDKANLKLGSKDMSGGYARPYWRVVPKNAQSLDSEICVGLYDDVTYPQDPCRNDLPRNGFGSYDAALGIQAITGRAQLDIPVRVSPAAPNKTLEWDVIFLSNDPDEPEVTVNVKAQSVILPPCQFQLSPTTLNFGLVTPPSYRDLSFSIRNLSSAVGDICLITNMDLKAGSDIIYSIPGGALDQYEMQPGEEVDVTVRSSPVGLVGSTVVTALGAVQFGISSPLTPQREVALSTSVATSCLTIAPSDLDFGTVQKDCNSSRRSFSIYNTCTTGVTVNSWSMVDAAGITPGSSPACPSSATSCPEFLMDGAPSFTMGTVILPNVAMPATFSLRYHPLDYGPDTGAFLLKVTQNGQVVDYIVTLRGNGDLFGKNIDTFRQDSRPKADILLVVDNSCSMADKQTALSNNFFSFIRYATTANVDYQIGVINTDLGSNLEGVLIGDSNNPKILKPSTPMVEALFRAKVNVGINGGNEGMAEPATKALTAPIITAQNAGFLRSDAVLAVVIISDAGDQSPLAATVYENQLRNIKGVQHASMFSYNDIGPFASAPAPGCSYDDFTDISKNLYLVQRFNGVKDEICTPNWSSTLESIGKTAFGYRTNFFLTAEPDFTMGHVITVRIDGMLMQQIDPVSMAPVWSYDPVANAIVFEPLFVPEPGKTLTVEYFVVCN